MKRIKRDTIINYVKSVIGEIKQEYSNITRVGYRGYYLTMDEFNEIDEFEEDCIYFILGEVALSISTILGEGNEFKLTHQWYIEEKSYRIYYPGRELKNYFAAKTKKPDEQ